jgi:hypothetical protein
MLVNNPSSESKTGFLIYNPSLLFYDIAGSVLHYEFPDPIDNDSVLGTILDRGTTSNDGETIGRFAFKFDGNPDAQGFTLSTPIDVEDGDYIGIWLKPVVAAPGSDIYILDNSNTALIVKQKSDGKLSITLNTGAQAEIVTTLAFFTDDDTWVHLGICFGCETDDIDIYKNGSHEENFLTGTLASGVNKIAYVGAFAGVLAPWVGLMRDFCIYDLANINPKTAYLSPDITASEFFFKMDEGTGAICEDYDFITSNLKMTDGGGGDWDAGYNASQTFRQDDGASGWEDGLTFKNNIMFVDESEGIDCGKPSDFDFGTGNFSIIIVLKPGYVPDATLNTCFFDNQEVDTIGDFGFALYTINTSLDLIFNLRNGGAGTTASIPSPAYSAVEPTVFIGVRDGADLIVRWDSTEETSATDVSAYNATPTYNTILWTSISNSITDPPVYNRVVGSQGNLAAAYILNRAIDSDERATLVTELKARFA